MTSLIPWIVVTKEHYPRVFLTRTRIKDGSKYYGPYTNTGIAKAVLNLIRELYPVRTCRHAITPDYVKRGKGRLCLEYHLKNCLGCCKGMIDEQEYGQMIDNVKKILSGDTQELLDYLKADMMRLAEELRFEEAQLLKEKYDLIARYQSKSVIVSQTLDDIDVFGIDDDREVVYVNYMHVRRGAIVRSITLEYKRRLDESVEQILGYAIMETAEKFKLKYDEIVVPRFPRFR